MLAWLLIVSLLLFIFFVRPRMPEALDRASGRTGCRAVQNQAEVDDQHLVFGRRHVPIEELATMFDVHIVETVESHAELWTSPHDVSVVHASTRKGFVSALKQIDPHVHVDKSDAAGASASRRRGVSRGFGRGRNPGAPASIARGHTTVIDDIHALVSCLGEDGKR